MARVDLLEPYAVRQLRNSVKESLQSHGEECILLAMYHVVSDAETAERCFCFDEVYKQSDRFGCEDCYGTTFLGGVKSAARAWGMFGSSENVEDVTKQGVWTPTRRDFQTEFQPSLMEHDFVVRVEEWDRQHRPVSISGIYIADSVRPMSLRTGGATDQMRRSVTAQSTTLSLLQDTHPIYDYPVVGKVFRRLDGLAR